MGPATLSSRASSKQRRASPIPPWGDEPGHGREVQPDDDTVSGVGRIFPKVGKLKPFETILDTCKQLCTA